GPNPAQVFVVMMPFVALAVIVGIVYVQEGQRRIPVQYAKRVVGRRMTTGGSTYLPLRVNMAGVIPVIFAASIMAFPPTIGQLLGQNQNNIWTDFATFFNPGGWAYVVGEVFFIIIFTYFYTAVTFNPVERLQQDFGLHYYATGDILRAAVRDETDLGRKAKEYMHRGDLVPDEVIVGVIAERVSGAEAEDGFILDGFPRTIGQAEALDAEIGRRGRELTAT